MIRCDMISEMLRITVCYVNISDSANALAKVTDSLEKTKKSFPSFRELRTVVRCDIIIRRIQFNGYSNPERGSLMNTNKPPPPYFPIIFRLTTYQNAACINE